MILPSFVEDEHANITYMLPSLPFLTAHATTTKVPLVSRSLFLSPLEFPLNFLPWIRFFSEKWRVDAMNSNLTTVSVRLTNQPVLSSDNKRQRSAYWTTLPTCWRLWQSDFGQKSTTEYQSRLFAFRRHLSYSRLELFHFRFYLRCNKWWINPSA